LEGLTREDGFEIEQGNKRIVKTKNKGLHKEKGNVKVKNSKSSRRGLPPFRSLREVNKRGGRSKILRDHKT